MKIGILQTGLLPDALKGEFDDYPSMFEDLLDGYGFTFETWAVVKGAFPDGPEAADGWLITGSRHGVYEDHPWIPPLEQLIRDIMQAGRPLIGVCFGHQIIAQALGGEVQKFERGWSVGHKPYHFEDETLILNAWHQDQVITPPEGAQVLAHNDFCANAALLYPGRAYSIQPHPEYGDAFIAGLIRTRGRGVVPDTLLDAAEAGLDGRLDNARVADQFATFFKERTLR